MAQVLQFFVLLPLLGFFIGMLLPARKERLISGLAIATAMLHLIGVAGFIIYWLLNNFPVLDIKHISFFKSEHLDIFIDFYFDRTTAVFAFVGSFLTLLVAIFSRFYLHRDEGYKRYFTTLMLFFIGYNLVVFSGNFETLFIGWEVLGICSFLLISFYRDRYLPVKNGFKVISIYRLGDICLILTMWMSHQLWHQNVTFLQLNDTGLIAGHLLEHNYFSIFICIMLVLAAATKSAQLPFSSWLPRAMEGPTTSSAIFYGSLSVHLGVFLLLRTYPYWESLVFVKVLIIGIGLATSIVSTGMARVQSTVKTQIAYASLTQIGLMFIEVALGWHLVALIHFAGNAFLRSYQLLVSPSVLSYQIHDMVFNFKPRKESLSNTTLRKIRNSFWILSTKEWNIDHFLYRYLWSPFKWIGAQLRFLGSTLSVVVLALLFSAGLYLKINQSYSHDAFLLPSYLFSLVALLLILRSFAERRDAMKAWSFILAGQLFMTLSITLFHEDFGVRYILIYLSGIVVSSAIGYFCLARIRAMEQNINLDRFHGHVYEHKGLAFIFLLACLGLIGFPFTPTFIGMDLIFSHIDKQAYMLIILTALSFIFLELAVIRIYARIFLGQHKKAYHPIAYRSS
jgi:NADH:ubiquinone oxidoreductase subunit 5 (subunit L)/multisubunit Na+/H+ antiporter MnhA subunit